MEKGKRICHALKELRKRIADANNIPFEIEECSHKGDCPGSCPKCDSELCYLMNFIDRLQEEGKPIVLEGLMSDEELHKALSSVPVEQNTQEKPIEIKPLAGAPPFSENDMEDYSDLPF